MLPTLKTPPKFCQYASGPCDQSFEGIPPTRGIFLYPSEPAAIASTIEAAEVHLQAQDPSVKWMTWKDFRVHGQVIFCSICKRLRFTDFVAADVTTLNFNLMFEIGFLLGLEVPVLPIRDTTIERDKHKFDELGLLDVIGYVDFQNSKELAEEIKKRLPAEASSRSAGASTPAPRRRGR